MVARNIFLIVFAVLSIFCSTTKIPDQNRTEKLKKQAREALQLQLGTLRWQAYWNARTYPEYAVGERSDIPVFSTSLDDAIGFCAKFSGSCGLYTDRGRGLESVGSFRFDPRCDEGCQSVKFTNLYRQMPKIHPTRPNTNDTSQSKDRYFDPSRFAGRDYDVNAPTPRMEVRLSVEWTLPSLGIESLPKDEPPPEPESLLEWARNDAQSIFRPECGASVTVSIPYNFPPHDSIYVYFGLAPVCDDYAVLVRYNPDEGWRRGVDFFNPSDVLPLKQRIEEHLFTRLVVSR